MFQADDHRIDDYCQDETRRDKIERRQRAKRRARGGELDLTVSPSRRRCQLVGQWTFGRTGDETALLNLIKENLYPVLSQRRISGQQAVEARRALAACETILVRRYTKRGLLFRWTTPDAPAYWLVIREQDALTAHLDNLQYQFGCTQAERDARLRVRIELDAA
jgi:hypothetical protein